MKNVVQPQFGPQQGQAKSDARYETTHYANVAVTIGGERIKLGAVKLNRRNDVMAKIVNRLEADPASAERLAALVEVDIQPAKREVGELDF